MPVSFVPLLNYICCNNHLMMRLLTFVLFIFLTVGATAQTRHAVQISGVIVATDSLVPVPFANVYRTRDHRGTLSDFNGYFTMPAQVGDTLRFVYLGLKTSSFVVPDDTTQIHISLVQLMEEDTIMLPTVNILPFPERHRLRSELLALDLPGDNYRKFNRNAANIANYDGLRDFASEAYANSTETLNARYNHGFQSGGNLLDPGAWGRFMKALKSGEYDGK